MSEDSTLSRPLYFDRQSLRAEDLNSLVSWIQQSERRFNRNVIGFGVTCGMTVEHVDGDPWSVQVGPGYAISPSGAQIEVPDNTDPFDTCAQAAACLEIPGPCSSPHDLDPPDESPRLGRIDFGDGSHAEIASNPRDLGWAQVESRINDEEDQTRIAELDPFTALILGERGIISLAEPLDEVSLTIATDGEAPTAIALDAAGNEVDRQMHTAGRLEPQTLTLAGPGITSVRVFADGQILFLLGLEARDEPVGEVYLAVCPDERLACPRPAIPEACEQPDSGARFSRAIEGYRLSILCDLPEGHSEPSCEEVADLVCEDRHLPCPPKGPDCLVIATLQVGPSGIMAIDEFTHRRRLLPQWLQSARAECRCDEPTPTPTTPFSEFTPLTPFTGFSEFTPLTMFSPFSEFSAFTVMTRFEEFSRFTLLSDLSVLTMFTEPVVTGFTDPTGPVGPTGPIGPVFDEVRRFDRGAGRRISVTGLAGIGSAREVGLREIGVTNLTEFIETSSEELSEVMGLSEVKIAEMQSMARRLTLRGGR